MSINLCLYEDIIPVSFFAVGNHAFKIGPVVVGAGHGAVDISIENEDLVLFCIFFADMDLPFDGLLGLVFGGTTVPSRYSYKGVREVKSTALSGKSRVY